MKTSDIRLIACSLVAFFVGYFVAGNRVETRNVRSENTESSRVVQSKSVVRSVTSGQPLQNTDNTAGSAREKALNDLMPPEGEQKIFDEFVARTAKERDAEYTQVFSQLGLGAEAIDAFKQKLIDVHKKAISAGWPLSALATEKKAYDEELRSMLGEDKYARYRDYEETKPARRELQLIQSLEASNVSLKPGGIRQGYSAHQGI